jgi:hypothetical protein
MNKKLKILIKTVLFGIFIHRSAFFNTSVIREVQH